MLRCEHLRKKEVTGSPKAKKRLADSYGCKEDMWDPPINEDEDLDELIEQLKNPMTPNLPEVKEKIFPFLRRSINSRPPPKLEELKQKYGTLLQPVGIISHFEKITGLNNSKDLFRSAVENNIKKIIGLSKNSKKKDQMTEIISVFKEKVTVQSGEAKFIAALQILSLRFEEDLKNFIHIVPVSM